MPICILYDNSMIRKYTTLTLLLIITACSCLWAQKNHKSKPKKAKFRFAQNGGFSDFGKGSLLTDIYFFGGYSPLTYENNIDNGNVEFEKRGGIAVDLSGTYLLSDYIGVSLGIGLSKYNTRAILTGYTDKIDGLTDDDLMNYLLDINVSRAAEDHSFTSFDVPVMMHCFIPVMRKTAWIDGGLGFKAGVPIKGTYKLEESNIITKAFYPDLNFWLTDLPELGLFSNSSSWHPEGDIDAKLNMALVAEAGVLCPINENLAISARGYLSCGLNKPIKSNNGDRYIDEYVKYNSLSTLVGDAGLMQLGLRMGIVFAIGK